MHSRSYGTIFKDEQTPFVNRKELIFASTYIFLGCCFADEHTGLVPGYQSIAKYHKDINTVVIQFNNTTDFNGYDWNLAEILYSRIVKILKSEKNHK